MDACSFLINPAPDHAVRALLQRTRTHSHMPLPVALPDLNNFVSATLPASGCAHRRKTANLLSIISASQCFRPAVNSRRKLFLQPSRFDARRCGCCCASRVNGFSDEGGLEHDFGMDTTPTDVQSDVAEPAAKRPRTAAAEGNVVPAARSNALRSVLKGWQILRNSAFCSDHQACTTLKLRASLTLQWPASRDGNCQKKFDKGARPLVTAAVIHALQCSWSGVIPTTRSHGRCGRSAATPARLLWLTP